MLLDESLVVILGVIVALSGAGLLYDARQDDRTPTPERRRRSRAPRHRGGEALVGLGMILLGAALIGRDLWRFATLSVIIGFLCVAVGAVMNRDYLKELLLVRGRARRREEGEEGEEPHEPPPKTRSRMRIR